MSKYQNTPSNKNKTQAEFNDSLYSNILSLISVILSVLSLVCAIWIGKIANEFATKNSHLNYQLSVENPIAIELKNQELHVVEAQVNKERPNFNYNIMSFKINFDPLYISGEYSACYMKPKNVTIYEAYKMFINEQLFRNNSKRTLIWYNENLSAFFNWLGENKNVDSLTVENYKSYCTFLQHDYVKRNGQPLKSSSVNSRVRAIKAFYNYCIEEDLLPDFSKKLKATKIRKTEKLPLDDDEIHTLVSAFGDSALEERNRCWVILMCDSGLRRGEIINLQIGNVHLARGFMIVTGKGDKQRFVPLGELSKISLATYIRKYRNEAKESEPVFVNRFGEKCTINTVKQVFQKLKKQTGILRLHAHLLRHTFATNYLVDGGDLETLRLLMGHSDLQVTMMYLHLAENKKLLQRKHQSHLDMIINS